MPKYFIAILPPISISNEIIEFQKEIELHFGAVHAQKAPPHITAIPPFSCTIEKLEEFKKTLLPFLADKSLDNVIIHLDNFQRFESRTLFIDIAKNEKFEKFCKELKLFFNSQKIIKQRIEKHYFVPHITLANKDIKKRDFKLVWEHFKNREYQRNFSLESLAVLELVDGKWIKCGKTNEMELI
jgi:2'-5' RNA ligase